ncbi:MAG: YeeE/YedE thiosulfate transporter family protein [Bacteroidales bacterium]|nr:YeeE/YedE thiosulfate transporter family protein [Bacteroidales bacterium]
MTGPLLPMGVIGQGWDLVIALIIGMAFGYVLESAGFSSSRKLAGVFYGYDFTVLRVFFTAALTAGIGLLYFGYMGWIDMSMIYINETYLYATLVGGVIMGLGFISGGYCPGTSMCGVAIGKIDALVFTAGMFIGILMFSEAFPLLQGLYEGNYMGPVKVYDFLNMSSGTFMLLLIIVALVAFIIARLIQNKVKKVEY